MKDPVLDYALAAQWWGYRWEEFQELSTDDQSFLIAVYRSQRQIDAVMAYEQYSKRKKAEAAAARKGKR